MSLRPALRIARRDVRRAPGRSLLVVLMVCLPVSGAAFLDVVLRTADVRGVERIALELGRTADARVLPQASGDPIVQEPDSTSGRPPSFLGLVGEPVAEPPDPLPPTDPLPLLPPGTRVLTDQLGELTVRTTDGLTPASFRELDIADPIAQGLFTVVDGRTPSTSDEVAVSPALLETLGQAIGDELQVTAPEVSLRIVGTVRPVSDAQGTDVAVALPGTLLDQAGAETGHYVHSASLLVDTPEPVSWEQVLALNDKGIAVFSRAVVENPPPDSAVPLYADPTYTPGGVDTAVLLTGALVVGLAVAEVALLAGAAFAVGLRRQSRALGLLAATGAGRRQLRAVVLAQGVVLGAIGGVVGVVVGTLAGVVGVVVATTQLDRFLLSPDLRPLELAGLTLLGVLTGVLASVLPARSAARQDVVAALSGRRGVMRTRRRFPVAGLVTAGIGAALAGGGGAAALAAQRAEEPSSRVLTLAAVLIVVGALLTQLGLIVATPAILGGVGRLGRFLPLAPRLALRDAARHRGRTAPAVAAILGAVAGSVALTVYVASLSDRDERAYQPSMAYGQAILRGSGMPGQATPEELLAAVSREAPPDRVMEATGFPYDPTCGTTCATVQVVAPPQTRCPLDAFSVTGETPPEKAIEAARDDPRCYRQTYINTPFSGPLVGDYDAYVSMVGQPSAAAREAIAAGGMVVFNADHVVEGRGEVEVSTYDSTTGESGPPRSVSIPAVHVPLDGQGYVTGWLSPQAAADVGVRVAPDGVVVQYDDPPDDDTEEAVSAALVDIGEQGFFRVERGYRDGYGIGLLALLLGSAVITLGAAAVATGLAQADGRSDSATLAAVGADPRLRRRLTACQAAVVAGLGALLGTASGVVPTAAYLYADTSMRLVPPWTNLLVIAIVVPAVAALAAGLLTRSRLPLTRRIAT